MHEKLNERTVGAWKSDEEDKQRAMRLGRLVLVLSRVQMERNGVRAVGWSILPGWGAKNKQDKKIQL